MLQRLRLLTDFKIFAIGLLATLTVIFIACGVINVGHADKTECIRTIISTGCAVAQRDFNMLTILSLASLFAIAMFGLIKYWSSSVLSKLPVSTHWQMVFRELALIIYNFLQKAFRRGIIHGQIYNSAYIIS